MVRVELFETFVCELWSMTRSKGSIADDWEMFSIDIRLLHRLACVNKGAHAIVSSVTFRKVCLPLLFCCVAASPCCAVLPLLRVPSSPCLVLGRTTFSSFLGLRNRRREASSLS